MSSAILSKAAGTIYIGGKTDPHRMISLTCSTVWPDSTDWLLCDAQ